MERRIGMPQSFPPTLASPAPAPDPSLAFLARQPIVGRDGTLYGHEYLARLIGHRDVGAAFQAAPSSWLSTLTHDMLRRLRDLVSTDSSVACHHFVNAEKTSLAEAAIVEDLIATAAVLERQGGQLVVEATERPLQPPQALHAYLDHLWILRRHRIRIALDDCDISRIHAQPELDEHLCDYLKFNLSQLGLRQDGHWRHTHPGADATSRVLHACKRHFQVRLVAEVVETEQMRQRALELPFDFLQGYLLGKPVPADQVA